MGGDTSQLTVWPWIATRISLGLTTSFRVELMAKKWHPSVRRLGKTSLWTVRWLHWWGHFLRVSRAKSPTTQTPTTRNWNSCQKHWRNDKDLIIFMFVKLFSVRGINDSDVRSARVFPATNGNPGRTEKPCGTLRENSSNCDSHDMTRLLITNTCIYSLHESGRRLVHNAIKSFKEQNFPYSPLCQTYSTKIVTGIK